MNFDSDVNNIPLNKYVIIKKMFSPTNINLHDREGLFLAKIINYSVIKDRYTSNMNKEISILCSIFGFEEENMFDILMGSHDKSIIDIPEKIPVIKHILLSSIISYHILTPDEYPFLVGYCWLDESFKEEAFGIS